MEGLSRRRVLVGASAAALAVGVSGAVAPGRRLSRSVLWAQGRLEGLWVRGRPVVVRWLRGCRRV
ncbi:MAG: hypothetical protein K0Q61_113 [Rhodococcus erythropolis]|nr:hypothetical protein [Rhodococcus erythropolis]